MATAKSASRTVTIRDLLKPRHKAIGPVPLKVFLDNLLKSKAGVGWLSLHLSLAGPNRLAVINFAAIAVIVIALFGAFCAYSKKLLTAGWATG